MNQHSNASADTHSDMKRKTVSIVTPVYNSMRTLQKYFDAIASQTYPHNLIEIIIADGGSTDGTLEFIDEYRRSCDISVSIYENSLRTGEAGKAVGVRNAKNGIVCLLDSDNIIPDENWLETMLEPFSDENIIASEPIAYTWRKEDSTVNRYCALIGMNDPLCMFTGNYDRYCFITNKWTAVKRTETDEGNYISIQFNDDMIPTIGANGFFMRTRELLDNFDGDYLFDIDVLWELLQKDPKLKIAKVKTGIIHLYCPDAATFYRKQNRRIKDFLFFSNEKGRTYPWSSIGKGKIILFILCCVTILPLAVQGIIGWSRKHDLAAWAFHLPACWITLWTYGWGTVTGIFKKEAASRDGWKQ